MITGAIHSNTIALYHNNKKFHNIHQQKNITLTLNPNPNLNLDLIKLSLKITV